MYSSMFEILRLTNIIAKLTENVLKLLYLIYFEVGERRREKSR